MSTTSKFGQCQLTRTNGQYVDSHIIPLALTRLSRTGEKHIEAGIGLGSKKRANSWYDSRLVTSAGEDILADIDSRAIVELRESRLVWSGWGPERELEKQDFVYADQRAHHREIYVREPKALQLFFLSLLWRAAASTRIEFADFNIPAEVLEDIRGRVCARDPGRFEDYPVQLFQIISRGPAHNRTPLLERKHALNFDGTLGPQVDYGRFYFDGLVAHVHIALGVDLGYDYLSTCLGLLKKTIVFVHEFSESRTAANIREMISTVERERMTIEIPLNPVAVAVQTLWPRAMS